MASALYNKVLKNYMKKMLCLLAVVCVSHALFAQDSSMNNNSMDDKSMMHTDMSKMKDCVYMKDGKMMTMMHGNSMMMDKDMTMKNGATVMTDGTVKMKNGTTKKMKDGECMMMDGKMMMMKDDMMMHDSTNAQQ